MTNDYKYVALVHICIPIFCQSHLARLHDQISHLSQPLSQIALFSRRKHILRSKAAPSELAVIASILRDGNYSKGMRAASMSSQFSCRHVTLDVTS